MKNCQQLRLNFYGIPLGSGEISPVDGHSTLGYFIVEHATDSGWIEKQVRQLLVSGLTHYVFFGQCAADWQACVEREWHSIHADAPAQIVSQRCEQWQEFTERLSEVVFACFFVPTDIYLFYDDRALFDEAINSVM